MRGCAIRMWELNEMEPVKHLERRSESQRSGGAACECWGSLRMSSWEDEIQLNRELPALSEEMCVRVPGGVMGIEFTENKGVRGVREKFRRVGARSRIELSISDGKGVDIEE